MSRLQSKINKWLENGLIESSQAKSIIEYEEMNSKGSWLLQGFFILGAFAIGVGVISIIAANWRNIPSFVKLGANLLLLITVAWALYKSYNKNSIGFESLSFFYILLMLASIGLISQVFHTGGKLYQAFLFCCAISLPLVLLVKRFFTPFLWLSMFWPSLCFLLSAYLPDKSIILLCFIINIPIINFLLSLALDTKGILQSHSKALVYWCIFTSLYAIFASEIDFNKNKIFNIEYTWVISLAISLFTITIVWKIREKYSKSQKIIISLLTIVYFIHIHSYFFKINSLVLSAMLTVIILILMSLLSASFMNKRWFDTFLILAGIRFLIFYFQALGGLAATGAGLIVSGIIIISLVYIWSKYRNILHSKVKEILND